MCITKNSTIHNSFIDPIPACAGMTRSDEVQKYEIINLVLHLKYVSLVAARSCLRRNDKAYPRSYSRYALIYSDSLLRRQEWVYEISKQKKSPKAGDFQSDRTNYFVSAFASADASAVASAAGAVSTTSAVSATGALMMSTTVTLNTTSLPANSGT